MKTKIRLMALALTAGFACNPSLQVQGKTANNLIGGADMLSFQANVSIPGTGLCAPVGGITAVYTGTINNLPNGGIVTLHVPFRTDISDLDTPIGISAGATMLLSEDPYVSVTRDYSEQVAYTITSASGSETKEYYVNVIIDPPSNENNLLTFNIPGSTNITIDHLSRTIMAEFGTSTNFGSLVPAWTISPMAHMYDASNGNEICSGVTALNSMTSFTTLPLAAHFFIAAENVNPNQPVYLEYTLTFSLAVSLSGNSPVYLGYLTQYQTSTINSTVTGGTPPYSYKWSTNQTSQSITVIPTQTTIYSLTVTDADYSTASEKFTVVVEDIRCGNQLKNVQLCDPGSGNHPKSKQLCINQNAVKAALNKGAYFGICKKSGVVNEEIIPESIEPELIVFPNPNYGKVNIELRGLDEGQTSIEVRDVLGRIVYRDEVTNPDGPYFKSIDLDRAGIYLITVKSSTMNITKQLSVVR